MFHMPETRFVTLTTVIRWKYFKFSIIDSTAKSNKDSAEDVHTHTHNLANLFHILYFYTKNRDLRKIKLKTD